MDTLSSPGVLFGANDSVIQLEYWYHMHGATMGDLQVWVESGGVWDSITTFVGQQHANQADPWLKSQHLLRGYQGSAVAVHFLGIAGTALTSDMAVDDVSLDIPKSCIDPTTPVVTNITPTSADLGWTENGTATTWEIEWGLVGLSLIHI